MRRQVRVVGGLAIALAVAASCDGKRSSPAQNPSQAKADGPPYEVEVAPLAPCRAGDTCTVEVRLSALAGFKVNEEYPFKFLPAATSTFPAEGAFAANPDHHAGTLTIRFKPTNSGTAKVTGTFKFSVCDPDQCLIEEAPVAVDVPVS